jgi:hypothetical protein
MTNIDPNARGGKRRYIDSTEPEEYIPAVGEVCLSDVSLRGLADLFGSDKGSIKHNYCEHYTALISKILRDKAESQITIGELGVACGASLRMWAHHLPRAKVIGFDIRQACKSLCRDLRNVEIIIGDGTQFSTFLDKEFDLFIDDGSHVSEHIVKTFSLVWAKIRPGGFYVVEDLSCTYNEAYKDQLRKNLGIKTENERSTFISFVDTLLKAIDSKGNSVRSIQYHPQMLIIEKLNLHGVEQYPHS